MSVLSFDVADWPATTVWPQQTPPGNWCGLVGAWFAYQAFYYLGAGVYAALLMLTVAIAAWSNQRGLPDLWVRFVGLALICAAVGTAAALFIPASEKYLISGPGGILGTAAGHFLHAPASGRRARLLCWSVASSLVWCWPLTSW